MNKNNLEDLRNLIKNLLTFANEKTNALNRDSAPLWHYIKDKNGHGISLDSILLNDLFLYLSYLGLSDNELIDGELDFINYILDFNISRDDFLKYLDRNLKEDYANTMPSSFYLLYEYDKYLKAKGKVSQVEIVESWFDIFKGIGNELINIDGVLDEEKIAYDTYISNLRKNLDDLKSFNYGLMVMALKNNLDNGIAYRDMDDQFYKDIEFLKDNYGTDSAFDFDILSSVDSFLSNEDDSLNKSEEDSLLEALNTYFDKSLDSYKNESIDVIGSFDDRLGDINGYNEDNGYSGSGKGSKNVDEVGSGSGKGSKNVDAIGSGSEIDSINADAAGSSEEEESLEDVLAKLNKLVGLETVKEDVNSLINLIQIRKIREERGIKQPDMSLHLVFSGNPGTGKTTVARLLGEIYSKLGILSNGHLVETDRSGLVAGYVGQTAIKTQDLIKEAMGGILFIDEAYALSSSKGENDFGGEAIDTILKAMEDYRDDFIVIVAGYPKLMDEFLHSNPGLESRFNKHIYFEDYNPQELFDIFVSMEEESSLKLDEKSEKFLKGHFEDVYKCRGDNFANGRYVRNMFEKVLSNQANRLVNIEDISDDDLNTLTLEDFDDCF